MKDNEILLHKSSEFLNRNSELWQDNRINPMQRERERGVGGEKRGRASSTLRFLVTLNE